MEINYRHTNPVLHYGLLGFIYAVGTLTLLTHALMGGMGSMEDAGSQANNVAADVVQTSCNGTPAHIHTIQFTKNSFIPNYVSANRCDELVIKDTSQALVLPALGPHDKHIMYPGFTEQVLHPGQTYSFRLNKSGNFPIHDHLTDLYHATLNVQ